MKPKPVEQPRIYPRRLTSRCRPRAGQKVLWIWAVQGHDLLISTGVWAKRPADLSGGFLGGRPTHWSPWPIDFPEIPIARPVPRFSPGDVVKWVSQSGGHWKAKTGVVISQVEPGQRPEVPAGFRPRGVFGLSRRSVSWLVSNQKVVYWPRPNGLQLLSK